ncbi:MAG TPA: hypothetical protein VMB49_20620 [Acidobacteriaceae bacterium]|nr:hypothetical protein [Acidobacteriaceae bacterium]
MKSSLKKAAITLLAMPVFLLNVPHQLSAQDVQAGLWAGTWKFNPAKSKFPGNPPQVDQVTIDPDFTITVEETSSTGKQSKWSYKPQQGKAVPVTGRGENVTVIATKVSPYKTTQVWNYNGKPAKSYATLSRDGKTQTFHMSGTDKDGKPFTELVVFEKQ